MKKFLLPLTGIAALAFSLTACGGADFMVLPDPADGDAPDTGSDTYGQPRDTGLKTDAGPESDAAPDSGAEVPTDTGPADDGPKPPTKKIFVTAATWSANLGGLAGADSRCQGAASAASLSGTYKAWLSIAGTPVSSRIVHSDADYVLVNSVLVAHGYTGLTSGFLLHAIDRTETGSLPTSSAGACSTGGAGVWTDTTPTGAEKGYDCGAWTFESSSINGWTGAPLADSDAWTSSCGMKCSDHAALYCIEQ